MNKSLKFFKDLLAKLDKNIMFKRQQMWRNLVDALGLGSSNFCYESSSLSIRNFIKSNFNKSKIKAYVTIYFTTITYTKSNHN